MDNLHLKPPYHKFLLVQISQVGLNEIFLGLTSSHDFFIILGPNADLFVRRLSSCLFYNRN